MSPCPWAWGWEAPQVLEVGQEHTNPAPFSWLPALALPQSCDPCPLTQPLISISPDTAPSPSLPQVQPPTRLIQAPQPALTCPSIPCSSLPSSPSICSSPCEASPSPLHPEPLSLPFSLLPDPWVSLRFPPLRQRQAGVGLGLGPSPEAAPSPFCII